MWSSPIQLSRYYDVIMFVISPRLLYQPKQRQISHMRSIPVVVVACCVLCTSGSNNWQGRENRSIIYCHRTNFVENADWCNSRFYLLMFSFRLAIIVLCVAIKGESHYFSNGQWKHLTMIVPLLSRFSSYMCSMMGLLDWYEQ